MGAYLITQVLLQFPSHTARIRTVNISVYLSLLTTVWIISWTLRNRALPAVIEPPLLLLIYDLKGNDNVSATKIITIIALRCFRSADWIMTGSLVWVFGFQPLDNWQTFMFFQITTAKRLSTEGSTAVGNKSFNATIMEPGTVQCSFPFDSLPPR